MELHYDSGTSGYLILHNFDLHRFLGDGIVNPIKWMKMTELSRLLLAGTIYRTANGKPFSADRSIFLVRQQAHFTPNMKFYLNDVTSDKGNVVSRSIKVTHTTAKVGRSSAVYLTKLEDVLQQNLLATFVSDVVMVDTSTRKSVPFPNVVKEYVQNHSSSESEYALHPIPIPQKSLPTDAPVYVWSRKVAMLDTDHNGHANNSFYMTFPLEGLGSARALDFPLGLNKPVQESVIENFSLIMKKECQLGQLVKLSLWKTRNMYFNFIVSVANSDCAYLCIKFFE